MASAFEKTVSATEFKATCLDLVDQMHDGKLRRLHITKRGKPHLTVVAAEEVKKTPDDWFARIPRLVTIPEGLDLTEPVIDIDDIEAMRG
jgi:antitoxin (DNA-binding transcriptional repressor) of toxin-antitoxin stability system